MSARWEEPAAANGVALVARNTLLALAGLVIGAIVGLVVAGYAGWLPTFNFC